MAEAKWHTREQIPPKGLKIWVTDGEEIWLLVGSGEPFPDRATLCKFWTPALIPNLPNGKPTNKVED